MPYCRSSLNMIFPIIPAKCSGIRVDGWWILWRKTKNKFSIKIHRYICHFVSCSLLGFLIGTQLNVDLHCVTQLGYGPYQLANDSNLAVNLCKFRSLRHSVLFYCDPVDKKQGILLWHCEIKQINATDKYYLFS